MTNESLERNKFCSVSEYGHTDVYGYYIFIIGNCVMIPAQFFEKLTMIFKVCGNLNSHFPNR